METAAAAPTQQIAMTSWADEVAALGKSHAAKLRKYVIATNTDAQFRHVDMIREGWSTGDEGRSLTDGRIEWASPVFVDKLVRMGREAVEAAVVKQEEHETAVYSDTLFAYEEIRLIAHFDPTISALAQRRGWRWNVTTKDWHWGVRSVSTAPDRSVHAQLAPPQLAPILTLLTRACRLARGRRARSSAGSRRGRPSRRST